jgi:hypothetical protein
MFNTSPMGKKYPLILRSFISTHSGEMPVKEQTVNSDAEYQAFCKIADRRSHSITEEKHPDVIEQERLEAAEKAEIASLTKRKLVLDVKTGERIYKSYPWTQRIAWTGAIIAVLMALLKLAEVLKVWPYH